MVDLDGGGCRGHTDALGAEHPGNVEDVQLRQRPRHLRHERLAVVLAVDADGRVELGHRHVRGGGEVDGERAALEGDELRTAGAAHAAGDRGGDAAHVNGRIGDIVDGGVNG